MLVKKKSDLLSRLLFIFFSCIIIYFFATVLSVLAFPKLTIMRLKYNGGGDWYCDQTAIPNVISFIKKNCNITIDSEIVVSADLKDLSQSNFLFITGHGLIKLNDAEINNLRNFCFAGGFIYIDDCYGLDQHIRPLIKKIFPEAELVELPNSHKIYSSYFKFSNGLPKIHEHDNLPAQGFGIYINKKLALFYTYQSDIGDGCEDEWVHNLPNSLREQALKMFANIIIYHLLFNTSSTAIAY